jgi:hypothetical protein
MSAYAVAIIREIKFSPDIRKYLEELMKHLDRILEGFASTVGLTKMSRALGIATL